MNDDSGHTPNSVHDQTTPELVVNGDAKHLNGDAPQRVPSPPVESPATPISNMVAPDVKIDIDYQEQESDARHEPIPIKQLDSIEKPANASSTVPQVGTPLDPATIPIHPPKGTPPPPSGDLLEDVKMVEDSPVLATNGHSSHDDVVMNDNTETPATTPGFPADSYVADIATPSYPPHEEDQPPPAKRARMESEPNEVMLNSATPPPDSAHTSSANTPVPTSAIPSTVTPAQFRFCQSTIRSLRKLKDAGPFLRPVDYVALKIPHYPTIIKTPMDFSTIERKLAASNPTKPDPNPSNPRYYNSDEFISDVRLIFQNCITFNGPDHGVSLMGKRVELVFDKQIKQMPAAVETKPTVVKKVATPPPPPPPAAQPKKITATARRPSTSIPVIRRSDTEAVGRPKREIHPPPPKDLTYADVPKRPRKAKTGKDDGTAEQLRFCSRLLNDLHKKQYMSIASPFYDPVDWVLLDIPSYPKMVKKPMDLSTMRKKLDGGLYPTAQKFFDDFKLMIRNCFVFNPAGTPVNQAGIELQRVFDDKWKALPPLREVVSDEEEEEEEEEDSDTERQRAIAMMESQIEAMKGNIAALKSNKVPKEKKKKEKRDKLQPTASTSKVVGKQNKSSSLSKKKLKKPITENDVLTFEQKKDLSESIAKLDEQKLEKVIQIIHEGVPEIRDSTEEIELEIDLLPPSVLTKLYNFVIRPLRAPPTKRVRTGKGTGTGGLKRKSMDEDVEAEKIRLLEERMLLFDSKTNGGTALPPMQEASDSDSSDSDSSGSDSE